MLRVKWNLNNKEYLAFYWAESIDIQFIEKESSDCDYLEIWYPKNIDELVFENWGILFSYIHYKQKWGDRSSTFINLLNMPEERILKNINKNVRYEIRRAQSKDNLSCVFIQNITEDEMCSFFDYYHEFATVRGLPDIACEKVKSLINTQNFIITKVQNTQGETLAMHSYIYKKNERAELFTSSSNFRRVKDAEKKNLIGRANRLLHYRDMLLFKSMGLKIYDWGGAYLGDENSDLIKITDFKQKFGGEIEYSDVSIVLPCKSIQFMNLRICQIIEKIRGEIKIIVFWGYNAFGQYCISQLEKKGIHIEIVIDNNCKGEKGRVIYKDSILKQFNATDTLIISCIKKESFGMLSELFMDLGYEEGVNLFNCI